MNDLKCIGMENAQKRIKKFVKQGKWAIIGTNTFSYTVGLHYHNLPEVIMLIPSPTQAHAILNICAALTVDNKSAFKHGEIIKDIASMPMTMIDVSFGKRIHAVQAFNHYRHWDFQLQQLVWPDPQGLFPWEDGYDIGCKSLQPILGVI